MGTLRVHQAFIRPSRLRLGDVRSSPIGGETGPIMKIPKKSAKIRPEKFAGLRIGVNGDLDNFIYIDQYVMETIIIEWE